MKPWLAFGIGLAATVATAAMWHGPGGAADRIRTNINSDVRLLLDNYEMEMIDVALQEDPLTRRIILAGEADDFQRTEMVLMMEARFGVGEARWNRPPTLTYPLPLLAEAIALGLAAFMLGLSIASVIFAKPKDDHW